MLRRRIVLLSIVVSIIGILIFLCIFTCTRFTFPACRLKKEAARYEDYKKNLSRMPILLKTEQIKELKTMVNDYHVESAQKFGIPGLISETDVYRAFEEKKLVFLNETRFWKIKSLEDSMPYVTPDTLKLLYTIGERFQKTLKEKNLPLYRFTISSVLRTEQAQKRLMRKNKNATRNISSHQFGTSVDILFTEFDYTGEDNFTFNFLKHYSERPEFKKQEFDQLGMLFAPCLKTILARTLLEMQKEGKCLVIYERRQPVFHVTIATRF